jgi:succinoglycan biosynthesis protein ExoA
MTPEQLATADEAVLAPPDLALPFVTIAVPSLNEEHYIEACITSLIGQWPDGAYEILVLDGGSTDCTRDIVAAVGERHSAVVLVSNPRRIQAAAINLAAQLACERATVLVRADAHAIYAPDFVRRCVAALLTTGATSVVVPMCTRARMPGPFLQEAIAAAQSSRLGNGGAAHRIGASSGFVEHGHHAAFDLDFFRAIGGYDESFTHNEDAELDVRVIRAGGRIWMCAEAPVTYFPRHRFGRLAEQYFRHGGGRARTLRKHGLRPRPRQLIPVAALGGCMAAAAAAPFDPVLGLLGLLYPAFCMSWAITQMLRRRDPRLIAGGAALMTMHLAWALGFVIGFARARQAAAAPRYAATQAGLAAPLLPWLPGAVTATEVDES